MSENASHRIGVLLPIVLTALILGLDGLDGPKTAFVGLLAVMPMLAAVFVGPRDTALIGAFALAAGGVFGLFAADGHLPAQYIRLGAIAGFTLVAVAASAARVRRERELVDVRQIAEVASSTILRPMPPSVDGVPLAVSYTSAHRAANVGGDLYEAVSTRHGTRLVVGDVRGKGLGAVRMASVACGSFREAAHREASLADVALAMDAAVRRGAEDQEDFVTAVMAEIGSDATVTFQSCGHPQPLLLRNGEVSTLPLPPGAPLGLRTSADPAVAMPLQAGDRVLLFTDGVSEARMAGEFFPLEEAAAAAFSGVSLQEGLAALVAALHVFTSDRLHDDAALLVFEVPTRESVLSSPLAGDAHAPPERTA